VSCAPGEKVAVAAFAADIVSVHVPMPVQPPVPDQPANRDPAAGVAVRVTTAPLAKVVAQVAPQAMPAGLDVTVPLPVPALVTVNAKLGANVAVTDVAAAMATMHVPVPVQPPVPDQPANTEPAAGAAVRVTDAPPVKLAVQVAPQLIPAGLDVTVPVPVPALVTVSAKVPTANVAVTALAAAIVKTQVAVPVQPPVPDHPVNVDPAAGVAVSVTAVPLMNDAEQLAGQLNPAGADATVPPPAPALVYVIANAAVLTDGTFDSADGFGTSSLALSAK